MFLKTENNRLINLDKVSYFDITKCVNEDKAYLNAYSEAGVLEIRSGTICEVEYTLDSLADAIDRRMNDLIYMGYLK
jgi:hypothetical protein